MAFIDKYKEINVSNIYEPSSQQDFQLWKLQTFKLFVISYNYKYILLLNHFQ